MPRRKNHIASGLHQRRRGYYIRIRVPSDLVEHFGKTHIVESLQTRDAKEAERLALRKVADLQDEFANKREWLQAQSHPDKLDALLQQVKQVGREARAGKITEDEAEVLQDALSDQAYNLEDKYPEDNPVLQTLSAAFHAISDPSSTLLSEVVTEYLHVTAPRITKQTLAGKKRRLQILQDWLGTDRPIKTITRRLAGAYANQLEQRVMADEMSVKTAQDTLTDLSSFFNWTVIRGYSDYNSFAGQTKTIRASMRGDAKDVKRRPWTSEEMLKFFKTVDAESDLWAIAAIGLYSGMRLNEICETRTEDAKSNRIQIRKGKSKAAIRTVPVHPVIAPLVKHLVKNSKDGYLISRLKPGGPDGKRSWNISKRFGRHLRQAGVTDRAAVFHSLRANFTTALERARIPLNEIQTLIEHERKELALTAYSVGVSHKQLLEDVELVSFGKTVDEVVAGRIAQLAD